MADGTLVTITNNVAGVGAGGRAKGSIAADTNMNGSVHGTNTDAAVVLEGFIDRNEAMAGVNEAGVHHATRAVVPVGAVQTLVTNALDALVTAVADGIVELATARGKAAEDLVVEPGALDSGNEGMLRVVSMAVLGEASPAEVVVVAGSAVDKLSLGELLHAAVAGPRAGEHLVVENRDNPLQSHGSRAGGLLGLFLRLGLGSQALRRAVDDDAVLDETLDQPVVGSLACDTLVDTALAEVEVAIVASGAVVVSVRDGHVAAVAAHGIIGMYGRAVDSAGRGWRGNLGRHRRGGLLGLGKIFFEHLLHGTKPR